MSISERGAAEAAQAIASALEHAGLPYAIGGALALAVAGVPRGTADVDVNVFVGDDRVLDAIAVLSALGIELDREAALARAERDGMFVGRWDGMRIDVFLPSIPFAHEAARTRISIADGAGWRGWFLSAESVAVFKLLFFRGKAVRPELDRAYVRSWIVDMMGERDERVQRWDDLVARFATQP